MLKYTVDITHALEKLGPDMNHRLLQVFIGKGRDQRQYEERGIDDLGLRSLSFVVPSDGLPIELRLYNSDASGNKSTIFASQSFESGGDITADSAGDFGEIKLTN